MRSGVPQGSCLGPLLFLAYINDIDSCFANSLVLNYVDDMKCYEIFSNAVTSSCTLFQNDFYSVSHWSLDWQLHFNLCKCSCLHVGNTNGQHNYQIMNRPILSTETEKNLGILIRYDLKSSSHVSFIVQKAGKCLAVLNRNIVSRDKTVFLKLYKQEVRPHLELAVCV